MTNSSPAKEIDRREAVKELWHRGELRWKLHAAQRKMYDEIQSNLSEIITICSARRFGKTFMLCVIALETCLRKSNQIVKFACPKQKQVERILRPMMRGILADCPKEIKPDYRVADKIYIFPNGSQIELSGTDGGHADSLRGGYSQLWIVDEAGFCDDLDDLVNSILAPTADTTKGRGIVCSTPPPQPDHDFVRKFMMPARLKNQLFIYTIHDNPMINAAQLERILSRYPLRENEPKFLREYMCKVIIDQNRAIFPEFSEKLEKRIVYDIHQRPPFFDCYVSMDIGFMDFTVALFSYYDFKKGIVVVEDEIIINGPQMTTDKLASLIKQKEHQLWYNTMSNEQVVPYLRICDRDLILINDLQRLHQVNFLPAHKDNKDMAVNNARIMIRDGKVVISPRCTNLIYEMQNGLWDKNHKKFDHLPSGSHCDAIDALVYMLRHVQPHKNPYPLGYESQKNWDMYQHPFAHPQLSPTEQYVKDLFKFRSSLPRKKA